MKRLIILTLLFGLILGACASAQSPDLSGKSLSGTGTPAATNFPATAVIQYTRSGGLQGSTEVWLIYADGRLVGTQGQVGVADPTEVTRLVAEFDAIGLSGFPPPVSPEKNTCNDCYTYTVLVRSNGEEKTYTAQDAQPDVPDSFWTALKDLQNIFMPKPK